MKEIELTKGYITIVDDEDYEKFGKLKWYADVRGDLVYVIRRIRIGTTKQNKKITQRLHRLILEAPFDKIVDHVNGNTLDNRKNNLRLATTQENSRNSIGNPKLRKYSKNKGVKKNTNCSTWSARIAVDGKSVYLGCFETENEAAKAYNTAAEKYFNVFARLNKDID